MSSEKPPLGVMPRKLWEEERLCHLLESVRRFVEAGRAIQMEWIDELRDLSERHNEQVGLIHFSGVPGQTHHGPGPLEGVGNSNPG